MRPLELLHFDSLSKPEFWLLFTFEDQKKVSPLIADFKRISKTHIATLEAKEHNVNGIEDIVK